MKLRILVDMDEVLCDFVGGALAIHGWTRERLHVVHPVGTWSIVESMGLTQEDFWYPITMAGAPFWTRLSPLPWFADLTDLLDVVNVDQWHVVSSPSRCHTSYTGKVRWLKNQFGHPFDRFALTPHKTLFAKPGVVLIDDREENVERFIEAGGDGIVFPSRHNRYHAHADDPVGYVRKLLIGDESACNLQERKFGLPWFSRGDTQPYDPDNAVV